jgi:myo-inositol 2-dehydrogenase / D-chiro-inositol 1-dehydrogenase
MTELGVGLVGSGFIAEAHVEAFRRVPRAAVRAVASRTEARVRSFAERHGIPAWSTDYRRLVERTDVDLVVIGVPNHVHRDVAVAAAEAGKHVICEKPLARTLAEADEMIAACERAGVKLLYAEELCFAPKYVRAKELVDEGALGAVHLIRQGEQHFGPHSDWFWDVSLSGGGALMDMGCHAIEFCRWMYDKAPAEAVTAELGTFVHGDRTRGDDHAVVTVRFRGNRLGVVDTSWSRPGGIDDRAEIIGSHGVTYVDIARGSSLVTFSEVGYGYAIEKAPDTRGWTYTMFEELWNYGFPQEMEHFVSCLLDGTEPLETGADGRAVLEIIYAGYRAARDGRALLPVELTKTEAAAPPVDLWLERG